MRHYFPQAPLRVLDKWNNPIPVSKKRTTTSIEIDRQIVDLHSKLAAVYGKHRFLYVVALFGQLEKLVYLAHAFGFRKALPTKASSATHYAKSFLPSAVRATVESKDAWLAEFLHDKQTHSGEQVRVLAPTHNTAAKLPMAIFRCDSVQTRFVAAVVRARVRMILSKNGLVV